MQKKTRNTPGAIVFVVLLVLGIIAGGATVTWAKDLPASTFMPFNNKPTTNFQVVEAERSMYPTASGYILMSYETNLITGERDIKAQKLDGNGKEVWKKVYELKGRDTLLIMHIHKNGFLLGVNSQEGPGNIIRVLQIGGNGEVVWQQELPLQTVNTIATTNDNGFVIAGTSGGANQNIKIIKLDKSGAWQGKTRSSVQWEKTYDQPGNQQASQIMQLVDKEGYNDGYILTGYTDYNTKGQQDVYLLRLNAYGEVKWSRNYGSEDNEQGVTLIPMECCRNNVKGFLVAGNTETRYGDKKIYLIYVDESGWLQSWPDYQYLPDGAKERKLGDAAQQMSMALVPVPDGFKNSRKSLGKNVKGEGGLVLAGYAPDTKKVLVIRMNEYGHVLWQQWLSVPGDDLVLGTPSKGDSNKQEIAYSVSYPGDKGADWEVHVLTLDLQSALENDKQDKAIPKDEQMQTNWERVHWDKRTLKFEAMRDIAKEIKDLLHQQQHVPLTATSSARGEIEWPDTSYYLGNLVIGKADGEGTLFYPNGIWYKGSWKNNMFNGKGYLRFPTGEYYEGEFKDHMMHGKGVMKWPTGECYQGGFQFNMREGEGVFTWPGGVVFEGSFVKDHAEGMGIIRWPDGERYEGLMQQGKATGAGSYWFPSGEWYRGEFNNLAFDGVGVYHWPNGAYYVGQFKQDRLYGEGYYIWPNGVQQWGYWKDDRYLGTNPEAVKARDKW